MKKILILLIIPIILTSINFKDDDLIRIRVIANSNSEYDQKVKMNLSNILKDELYMLLKDEKNIDSARKTIKNNIDNIDNIVNDNVKDYKYNINYGLNYFPKKEYNGKVYKEGNYESLLITLGEGKGENWWCILFPPICLVEAEESENVEYDFFLKNIFTKLFK